jgi:hypothetical protein
MGDFIFGMGVAFLIVALVEGFIDWRVKWHIINHWRQWRAGIKDRRLSTDNNGHGA